MNKEKKFIVGKWYKAQRKHAIFYIKINKIYYDNSGKTDSINGVGVYLPNVDGEPYYLDSEYWSNRNLIQDALDSGPLDNIDEILDALPDNHPDKKGITPKLIPDIKEVIEQFLSYETTTEKTKDNRSATEGDTD